METVRKQRFSKIKRGWQLSKSSWGILRADKELASFPLFSLLAIFLLFVPFMIVFGTNHAFAHRFAGHTYYTGRGLIAWIGLILAITIVSNFFTAAIMDGAMERFNGGTATFKKSLRAAWRKVVPIVYFSLFMASVGIVIQLLAERIPFFGRLVAFLGGLAWAVANFFSLPVILFSDKQVAPLDATRESSQLVKKVWGESVVASSSIGVIGALALLAVMLVFAILLSVGGVLSLGFGFILPVAIVGGITYLLGIAILGALGGIIRAALYYYATTGQAPEPFTAETMRTALVPKKKIRRLFARS